MENNKNKKSVKFQGDMLNFYDFIQVFVFTTNHHLKCVKWIICFFLAIPSQYCIDWYMYHYIPQPHQTPIAQLGLMNLFGLFTGLKSAYLGFNILNFNPFALRMGKLHRVLAVLSDKGLNKNAA